MSSRNLSCPGCRIRVLANASNIDLLEGRCPVCGARLRTVESSASVMGFRLFDMSALSQEDASAPPPTPGWDPVDLAVSRAAALALSADAAGGAYGRSVAVSLPVH